VALIGRNQETLLRVAKEVIAFGGTADIYISDVRDKQTIVQSLDNIVKKGYQIDLVIISSGIAPKFSDNSSIDTPLRETVETNLIGVASWLDVLFPVLCEQTQKSSVAVLSSLASARAISPAAAPYAAGKAAVSTLCDGLRSRWRRHGIDLVTVEPGFIRTPMTINNSRMPLLMEPEDAAFIILSEISRGKRIIRFPKTAALIMGILRIIPAILLDKLQDKLSV
jgi:short-subunit dehydrogenase